MGLYYNLSQGLAHYFALPSVKKTGSKFSRGKEKRRKSKFTTMIMEKNPVHWEINCKDDNYFMNGFFLVMSVADLPSNKNVKFEELWQIRLF